MKAIAIGPNKGVPLATVLGFAVTSIAILALALTWVDSAERSEYFWQRVIWTEFLAGLVWAYIGGFFSLLVRKNRSVKGLGAILPGLGVAIFFYAGSSFLFMMVAVFWPGGSWELVSQIYKAAGLIIVIIFLYFSWAAGVAETEPIPAGVLTPNELAVLLRRGENALQIKHSYCVEADLMGRIDTLRLALKALREKLEYAIPHAGRIGGDACYVTLSGEIEKLSKECLELTGANLNAEKLQLAEVRVAELISEVQSIAQTLRSG